MQTNPLSKHEDHKQAFSKRLRANLSQTSSPGARVVAAGAGDTVPGEVFGMPVVAGMLAE